jgi:hypothetical protein
MSEAMAPSQEGIFRQRMHIEMFIDLQNCRFGVRKRV